MNARDRALLVEPVRKAVRTLAWIEAREGPIREDGYARIEMTVREVRQLAALLNVESDQWSTT